MRFCFVLNIINRALPLLVRDCLFLFYRCPASSGPQLLYADPEETRPEFISMTLVSFYPQLFSQFYLTSIYCPQKQKFHFSGSEFKVPMVLTESLRELPPETPQARPPRFVLLPAASSKISKQLVLLWALNIFSSPKFPSPSIILPQNVCSGLSQQYPTAWYKFLSLLEFLLLL